MSKYSTTTNPPTRLIAITPHNTNPLPIDVRAISVAVTGNVKVTTVGGDEEDFYAVAGIQYSCRATHVWADGTDATGIRGWA